MCAKPARASLADFVQFTNVARRDTGNTDYIVVPLAAGVLAHLILAEPEPDPAAEDAEETIEERVAAARLLAGVTDQPPTDFDIYREATDLVLMSWDRFHWWAPFTFRISELDAPSIAGATHLERARAWLAAHPAASLVDSMLMAALALDDVEAKDDECPLLARSARRIRVPLAHRLRGLGDSSWAGIVRAVHDDWVSGAAERLAFHLATAAHEALYTLSRMGDRLEELETREAEESPPTPAPEPAARPAPDTASLEELEILRARYGTLEQKHATLLEQHRSLATREARWTSRFDAQETRINELQARLRALEARLATAERERDQLLDAALPDEAIGSTTEALPADALRGRHVILFTAETSGEARAELERSFLPYGPEKVTTYHTDRDRGPAAFSGNAVVVIDIRYLPHTTYYALARAVRQAAVPWYVTRRSSSLIAHDVVSRLLSEGSSERS